MSADFGGGIGKFLWGCRHWRQGVSAFATGGFGIDFPVIFELFKLILLIFLGVRAVQGSFAYFF